MISERNVRNPYGAEKKRRRVATARDSVEFQPEPEMHTSKPVKPKQPHLAVPNSCSDAHRNAITTEDTQRRFYRRICPM